MRINPEALRVIRRDREVRLVDLARAVQCTPSHLTNVEAGRREASVRLIRALARELKVPLLSLLGPEVRPDESSDESPDTTAPGAGAGAGRRDRRDVRDTADRDDFERVDRHDDSDDGVDRRDDTDDGDDAIGRAGGVGPDADS